MNMKRYLGLCYLMLLGLLVQAQSTWQTRFVFEFFRDDTSLVKTYDTLWIGLDTRGDKGFQDSLDVFVDSIESVHAYFVDTAFYAQYQGKKLVKDIRRFPDKVGETSFWCYVDKAPTTIYYDTNTIQLHIPPFLTTIWGEGPLGSSIGAWHSNSVTFLLMNYWYPRSYPAFGFYDIPSSFYFKFTISLHDSLKVGLEDQLDFERINYSVSENALSISGLPKVNHGQLMIRDMTGKTFLQLDDLSIANKLEVPIEAFPRGIYILSLQTQGNVIYKKFFKP
jgi:hypothetical protein